MIYNKRAFITTKQIIIIVAYDIGSILSSKAFSIALPATIVDISRIIEIIVCIGYKKNLLRLIDADIRSNIQHNEIFQITKINIRTGFLIKSKSVYSSFSIMDERMEIKAFTKNIAPNATKTSKN